MFDSKFIITKETKEMLSHNKLSKQEKTKLRLERVKELVGDKAVTMVEMAQAAGFDMNKQYKTGASWIYSQVRRGILSQTPSGLTTEKGRPLMFYQLVYIPEGKVSTTAKNTIRQFTKDDIKKISARGSQEKAFDIQVCVFKEGETFEILELNLNKTTISNLISKLETIKGALND